MIFKHRRSTKSQQCREIDRRVINGYELINVNASDPASLINSGRRVDSHEKVLSPINNVSSKHHHVQSSYQTGQNVPMQEESFINLLNQSTNVALKQNVKPPPPNKPLHESEYLQRRMAEMEKQTYEGSENPQSFLSGTLGATGASQFQMLDSKALHKNGPAIFLNHNSVRQQHQVKKSGDFPRLSPTLGSTQNIRIQDEYASNPVYQRHDTSSFRQKMKSIEYSEQVDT